MNQPARIAHACWAMLAASFLLLARLRQGLKKLQSQ